MTSWKQCIITHLSLNKLPCQPKPLSLRHMSYEGHKGTRSRAFTAYTSLKRRLPSQKILPLISWHYYCIDIWPGRTNISSFLAASSSNITSSPINPCPISQSPTILLFFSMLGYRISMLSGFHISSEYLRNLERQIPDQNSS